MLLTSCRWASGCGWSPAHPLCSLQHDGGYEGVSTSGFLFLGRDVHFTQALQEARTLQGLMETRGEACQVSSLVAGAGEHLESEAPCGPARPLALMTLDRAPSVCFLIWKVDTHGCVCLQSERGDSLGKSGQSPRQVPGTQHSSMVLGSVLVLCRV